MRARLSGRPHKLRVVNLLVYRTAFKQFLMASFSHKLPVLNHKADVVDDFVSVKNLRYVFEFNHRCMTPPVHPVRNQLQASVYNTERECAKCNTP